VYFAYTQGMRKRVPGYLGNTHYWFGNVGLGASKRTRTPQRIARDAERERKRQERDAQRAQQKAAKQARVVLARAKRAAKKQKQPSPKRSGPSPLITPKAMAPKAMVEEQMLMQELEQMDVGGGPAPMMDSGGGGGGGSYTPSSGGKAAPTAEDLLAEREEKAITVAEQLAAQYQGKPRPKIEPMLTPGPSLPQALPQESAFKRKRPGIFGPILDVLFGPPSA
jgi:hypothetical protein